VSPFVLKETDMSPVSYRYIFDSAVSPDQIEASLLLAIGQAEALYGEAQVRLDFNYHLDPAARGCTLDGTSDVGRDINRLFVGFVRRQFGEDSFVVERASSDTARRQPQPAS
jgi:hypothetical protein